MKTSSFAFFSRRILRARARRRPLGRDKDWAHIEALAKGPGAPDDSSPEAVVTAARGHLAQQEKALGEFIAAIRTIPAVTKPSCSSRPYLRRSAFRWPTKPASSGLSTG